MNPISRLQKCNSYLNDKPDSSCAPKKHINSMFLRPTCPDEISKIIAKFQNKNSTGLDGISPKVLKLLPKKLIMCLAHIFNMSLAHGKFLDSFKTSKVIPIHKKKDKSDMNNYRPISLLPVCSKILEKIMHVRLYEYMDRKNAFYMNQFGFRPGHSTDQAGAVLIEKISNALNKNLKVASVFLDM